MRINADFSIPAVKHFDDSAWWPSPSGGVERIMLDRIGGEVARATSLVRYAPGSRFPGHVHGGGEEFFVLHGVFSDERGDYPAGTYVRNPIGSAHTPFSDRGCVIWVKLWQFQADDAAHVVADTSTFLKDAGRDARRDLHAHGAEQAYLQRLPAGGRQTLEARAGGAEVFVLSGSVRLAGKTLGQWSWYRSPKGSNVGLTATDEGACLLVKTGHLAETGFSTATSVPAT